MVISLGGCFGLQSTEPQERTRGLKAQSVASQVAIFLEKLKGWWGREDRKISELDTEP